MNSTTCLSLTKVTGCCWRKAHIQACWYQNKLWPTLTPLTAYILTCCSQLLPTFSTLPQYLTASHPHSPLLKRWLPHSPQWQWKPPEDTPSASAVKFVPVLSVPSVTTSRRARQIIKQTPIGINVFRYRFLHLERTLTPLFICSSSWILCLSLIGFFSLASSCVPAWRRSPPCHPPPPLTTQLSLAVALSPPQSQTLEDFSLHMLPPFPYLTFWLFSPALLPPLPWLRTSVTCDFHVAQTIDQCQRSSDVISQQGMGWTFHL